MEDKRYYEELQFIFDTVPYEITLKNMRGNYIYCNKRFAEAVSCTDEQIINHNMSSFWDEEDCEELKKMDVEVYGKNKGVYFERKLRSSSSIHWYNIYKAPLVMHGEKCIITMSEESTINKGIGNLMTYEIEKDSHDILGYHDILNDENEKDRIAEDYEFKKRMILLCRNLLQQLLAVKICIYLYDGKDDLKIYEIRYGNNILGIMNIYYGSTTINFDMAELVKSTCYKFGLLFQNRIIKKKLKEEEEKKLEYKQALHMEKLKTEFFAGVSHEFRTPLNIIATAVQLIDAVLKDCDCEKYKNKIQRNMQYIKQNSNRLIRLVNNIIDVNKIDAGNNSLNYTNCNIVEVIEDIAMSVKEYIKLSGKNLIFDTEEEEIITACDTDKIERIMMNLLSNAIKYSDENTDILINMKLNEAKDKVITSVYDKGAVIDKKDDDKIFAKYVQLDKLFNRPCEGSGIGLYLVKSFVKQHGGDIWINYEVKDGTEVNFTIPIKTVEENEVAADLSKVKSRVETCNVEFSDIYSI